MPITTNYSLPSPDDPNLWNIVTDMAIMMNAVDLALLKVDTLRVGTGAQRAAFTSATTGTHWQDTDGSQAEFVRIGANWKPVGVPTVASQAARDILIPLPTQNDSVFRSDRGWTETYFALYNVTTNPGGATPAGWYPTGGLMPFAQIARSDNAQLLAAAAWVNYSGNTIWNVAGSKTNGFVPYNAGWTAPFSGRYSLEASLSSKGAAIFGGVSLDPSTSGRTSLLLESTTATPAFSIGKLSLVGTLELNAGDKVYIKATATSVADMNLWRSSEANDAGRFNLTYIGPKR